LCKSLVPYTYTYFWAGGGWLDMQYAEEIFTDLDKVIKNFKKAISHFKLKEKKLEKLETAYAKLLEDLWLALQDKLRKYAIYHTYGCQIYLMQWGGSVFLAGIIGAVSGVFSPQIGIDISHGANIGMSISISITMFVISLLLLPYLSKKLHVPAANTEQEKEMTKNFQEHILGYRDGMDIDGNYWDIRPAYAVIKMIGIVEQSAAWGHVSTSDILKEIFQSREQEAYSVNPKIN
jgi:hypothetical protein